MTTIRKVAVNLTAIEMAQLRQVFGETKTPAELVELAIKAALTPAAAQQPAQPAQQPAQQLDAAKLAKLEVENRNLKDEIADLQKVTVGASIEAATLRTERDALMKRDEDWQRLALFAFAAAGAGK